MAPREGGSIVPITFRMDGPGLREGFPLLDVTTALQEFHFVVDKSFLALTGGKKMTPRERRNYSIMATEFRSGSFLADLQLGLFAGGAFLPGLQSTALQARDVWKVTKKAYDYLKVLLELRSKGKEPTVNVTGDRNLTFTVLNGNINVSQIVLDSADRAEAHYKKLTSTIRADGATQIATTDEAGEGIVLTEKEKKLFNPVTRIEKEILRVVCNIVRYDKLGNFGKLNILEDQPVPPGTYTFKSINQAETMKFIRSMARESVTLNVLKEIETHTTCVERIAALHVVSIEEINEPALF